MKLLERIAVDLLLGLLAYSIVVVVTILLVP